MNSNCHSWHRDRQNCVPLIIPKSLTWKTEKCDIDRCEWLMPDDTSIQTDHSWNSILRIYQFLHSAHNLHPLKHSLFHEWRVLIQLFAFNRVLPLDLSCMQQWKMAAGLATTKWTAKKIGGGGGRWSPKSAIVHLYIKKLSRSIQIQFHL